MDAFRELPVAGWHVHGAELQSTVGQALDDLARPPVVRATSTPSSPMRAERCTATGSNRRASSTRCGYTPRVSIDLTVREQLDRLVDVPYELFPCDPALADTANFCAAYGFKPEDVREHDSGHRKSRPRCSRRASCWPTPGWTSIAACAKRLGTRKASFAPAEDTRAITGMEIGGVTVFGLPDHLPIWIDARVMHRERVVLGGGSRSFKVIAAPAILLKLPRAEVVEGLALDAT